LAKNVKSPIKTRGIKRRGQDSNNHQNPRENHENQGDLARNPARSPLEELLHSLWTDACDTSRLEAIAILQEGKTTKPRAIRSRTRSTESSEPITRAAYAELANWPLIQRLLLLLGKKLTDSQKKTVNDKIRELTFEVADFTPETR
jgi:hypothetical protein